MAVQKALQKPRKVENPQCEVRLLESFETRAFSIAGEDGRAAHTTSGKANTEHERRAQAAAKRSERQGRPVSSFIYIRGDNSSRRKAEGGGENETANI